MCDSHQWLYIYIYVYIFFVYVNSNKDSLSTEYNSLPFFWVCWTNVEHICGWIVLKNCVYGAPYVNFCSEVYKGHFELHRTIQKLYSNWLEVVSPSVHLMFAHLFLCLTYRSQFWTYIDESWCIHGFWSKNEAYCKLIASAYFCSHLSPYLEKVVLWKTFKILHKFFILWLTVFRSIEFIWKIFIGEGKWLSYLPYHRSYEN